MVFILGIYENQGSSLNWQKTKLLKLLWKRWRFLGQRKSSLNLEDESSNKLAALHEQPVKKTSVKIKELDEHASGSGSGSNALSLEGISSKCLSCICHVESGCAHVPCSDGGASCGPYQIRFAYWIDGGCQGGKWRGCVETFGCAENTIKAYMRRHARREILGYKPTCKDYARIHNGGPSGYMSDSTLSYWRKIQDQGCNEYD
mgnify:FL=1